MEISTLVDRLEVVGLSDVEAEAYVRLLQKGTAKAGTLAPTVSMSRSKLYRVLDDLADRGLVEKSLERPTVYEPLAPKALFESRLNDLGRAASRVRETREELLTSLDRLAGRSPEAAIDHWNLVEGRSQVYATLQNLLEDARRSIWHATNHEVSGSDLREVEQARRLAVQRAADGVSVRSLAAPPGALLEPLDRDPGDLPLERRVLDVDEALRLALIDGDELLLWVRNEPLESSRREAVALHTDAPSLVDANRLLFERLWSSARPAEP